MPRHASIHAAGVVIGREPLACCCLCSVPPRVI
jgi:DNA polymerase III alpha subunit